MPNPRVFVSSTIFDFQDLRSALKYWLGELGYDAQLSDFNDFEKRLDINSFQACLDAIPHSDYFVLLIGGRRGGLFDENANVSITRAEYRAAYESFKTTGRPRIVAFVRHDVMTAWQERRDVVRAFDPPHTSLLSRIRGRLQRGGVRATIETATSRVMDHPKEIGDFIQEVRRADEMASARDAGSRPPGNWLHSFQTFEDVVDVLRREFRVGGLRRSILIANIRALFADIVTHLTETVTSGPDAGQRHPYYARGQPLRDLITIDTLTPETVNATHRVPRAVVVQAGFLLFMAGLTNKQLSTDALEEAARSGEFHAWNAQTHRFEATPLLDAIARLIAEIEILRKLVTTSAPLLQLMNERASLPEQVDVTLLDLIPALAAYNRHSNIIALMAAIRAAFDGRETVLSSLRLWDQSASTPGRLPLRSRTASPQQLETFFGMQEILIELEE